MRFWRVALVATANRIELSIENGRDKHDPPAAHKRIHPILPQLIEKLHADV